MSELGSHWEREDLGNGRFRHVQYMRPIAYVQNGAWRRMRNRLGASGDPALAIGSNELTQFRLRNRLSGNAPVVHFGAGKSMVRLTPLDTANVQGKPYGENGREYPGAWSGADLRLINGGHILRKEIALHHGHPKAFSFRIDEHIGLDEKTLATPDFRFLNPMLEHPQKDAIALKWRRERSGTNLVLTADLPDGDWAGWTLDPTLVLQPGADDGIDTYLRDGAYANINHGSDTNIVVKGVITPDFNRVGLLKFSLSGMPLTATITAVTLYGHWDMTFSAAVTITMFKCLRNWVENEATWNVYSTGNSWGTAGAKNNVTDYANVVLSTNTVSSDPGMGAEIAFASSAAFIAAATAAIGGTLNLVLHDLSGANANWAICSSDHATESYRPKLVIDYTAPAGLRLFSVPFAAPLGGPFL